MVEKVFKVAVLLATHNGISWLDEQIDSILGQDGVKVKLIVSDDASIDGTLSLLQSRAQEDARIEILPSDQPFGSAGRNFFQLILNADISDCDYVALADQDDIWLKTKLKRHISLSMQYGADAVSSNVVAFWRDGSRGLIDKSQPPRRLDFLFESAGPGCTFLLSPSLINQVRSVLFDPNSEARQIELHDWLIYSVCRVSGKKWYIDSVPSLKYRQHASNVVGVNYGLNARWTRLKHVINGWYRREVVKICKLCLTLNPDPYTQAACNTIIDKRLFARFRLLALMPQARRNFVDRVVLVIFTLLFLF